MVRLPKRVLCLHGGGTNEAVLVQQTAKLRAAMKGVSFDFHEATRPYPLDEVDPRVRARFGDQGGYFNWFGVEFDRGVESIADYVPTLLDDSVTFRYVDAEAALDTLDSAIQRRGPYDALLGFSQGAILITLLTALTLRRGNRPSWRANLCVCGMPVRDNSYRQLFEQPLDFPAMLAFGTADPFYPWASRLRAAYKDPTVVEYGEGHRFPHDREANTALATAIQLALEQGDLEGDLEQRARL